MLAERHWVGAACTCSGWDNRQETCWVAHGLTAEMDNNGALSGWSLCEAARSCTASTAPWRDAKNSNPWMEVLVPVVGIWHLRDWIILSSLSFQSWFGPGLQPSRSLRIRGSWLGVGPPRHLRFSMIYNNGAHCVHTAHLAFSDKWFWRKVHLFLRFHHTSRCFIPRLSTCFCLIIYPTVASLSFTTFLSSYRPFTL